MRLFVSLVVDTVSGHQIGDLSFLEMLMNGHDDGGDGDGGVVAGHLQRKQEQQRRHWRSKCDELRVLALHFDQQQRLKLRKRKFQLS